MIRRPEILFLWLLVGLTWAEPAGAWRLVLPAEVDVEGRSVRVADVSRSLVPAAAGDVVLLGRGQPGTSVQLTRQVILRKLVQAGLAGGVSLQGADMVQVNFRGRELDSESLRQEIRQAVQPLVPAGREGAPASWFELIIPETSLNLPGHPEIKVQRSNPLLPGRNQLRVALQAEGHREELPVTVVLHCFGEIPTARQAIDRRSPLQEEMFTWSWLDLAEVTGPVVSDRMALQGACAGRTIPAGDRLRPADLKPIPVIQAGDTVEMQIQRGRLLVSVQGLARQDGCLGQTIPVRNELNGRLVNARVAGPGLVEWRN